MGNGWHPSGVSPEEFSIRRREIQELAKAAGRDPDSLTWSARVEVEAHRYWWRITYPDEGVETANEVVVPTGETVELALTTEDVIHSFWVPQLAGKVDMIPGRTNELVVEADEPGEYQGYCAEYCGLAHSQMRFLVVAMEPEEYAEWVEGHREPAPAPETELARQGQQAFMGSGCVYCHRIDGTNATSDVGPDLTHLASRRTLAAGLVPNNPGHLAAWIVDPQDMKPGNAMPGTMLEPEELQALLVYLETLE
jgi:cytochrome c oxidase subunit II